MDAYQRQRQFKAEKITVTLTLGEVDILIASGRMALTARSFNSDDVHDLEEALQKLDEAVNV